MPSVIPFSTAVRERSAAAHSSSEHAGFMSNLVKGDGTLDDYIALVAQHYFIYVALEGAAEQMRQNPLAAKFITDALTRLPAVEADLEALLGAGWREQISPLPATQRYVDRINEVGPTWAGGFIAHHYTRYLGDLSGGQIIKTMVRRHYGVEDGLSFYEFEIDKPKVYKDEYRAALDALPLSESDREAALAAATRAFELNHQIFLDLEAAGVR
jgi:heme oxygenase